MPDNQHESGKLLSFLQILKYSWIVTSSVVTVAAAVFGIVVGIPAVFSHSVDLEVKKELDPANSATRPFYVLNDGAVSVHDIRYKCKIQHLKLAGGVQVKNSPMIFEPAKNILEPGRRSTIFCNNLIGGVAYESGEMTIYVSYRPAYRSERTTKEFPFQTVRDANGDLRWLPTAVLSE